MNIRTNRSRLLSLPAPAHIYHFDSVDGDDSNPGTLALPFKTVAKHNALTKVPTDWVLWKRGCAWTANSHLDLDYSGVAGQKIIYGAYGVGARPQFHPSATYPAYMTSSATATSHLIIAGLDFFSAGVPGCMQIGLADSWMLDCLIHGSGDMGYGGRGAHIVQNNMTIEACQFYDNALSGIDLGAEDAGNVSSGAYILDNLFRDEGTSEPTDHHIYLRQINGGLVRGNEGYNGVGAGVKLNGSAEITVDQNRFHDNARGVILGGEVGEQMCDRNTVAANLLENNSGEAIEIVGRVTNGRIAQNTLIGPATNANALIYFEVATNTGVLVENNIFVSYDGKRMMRFATTTERTGNGPFNNNLYYLVGGALGDPRFRVDDIGLERTLVQWQALGHDLASTEANPLFVSSTDRNLQAGSPARALGAAGLGITFDIEGIRFGADAGAYQYV